MNVIVSNKNEGLLSSLDVDVIKSIKGEFTANEIIGTFSNFFFNRMFLDITAIKDFSNIENIQQLSMGLEMDKVILLVDNSIMNNPAYLSKLISMGIYNFGKDKETIMYLYNHPNTYKDVAQYHNLNYNSQPEEVQNKKNRFFKNNDEPTTEYHRTSRVIGFKDYTSGAGATTLVYMLKKYLSKKDYVVAIEVNKNDFGFFNEKDMYSVNQSNLAAALNKFDNAKLILVDINNGNLTMCDEVIYLMEPSIIKLNKMLLINKNIFDNTDDKKIVLNKSLLSSKDVHDFEYESNCKISYNLPPLNDREENESVLQDFVTKLEI